MFGTILIEYVCNAHVVVLFLHILTIRSEYHDFFVCSVIGKMRGIVFAQIIFVYH